MKEANILSFSKVEARQAQEDAISKFLASGGQVEVLKGRRTPKSRTVNGKFKGGKVLHDPTARFPKEQS
jgi:acetyl/propionyl-CoA carboxylase alpha subunit